MTEVQFHGFTFEKWVRDTFFGGYAGNYGQKWDIPADASRSDLIPETWRGYPASIKTAKYGSPIGLGDALRQRQIDEPFLMIVGFWRQRTATEKWIEGVGVAYFSNEAWAARWGELALADLEAVNSCIRIPNHTDARKAARAWKKSTVALKTTDFVINPKIDSKGQRRIQCSLPFKIFGQATGRPPTQLNSSGFFGIPFPNPIQSSARTFNASTLPPLLTGLESLDSTEP